MKKDARVYDSNLKTLYSLCWGIFEEKKLRKSSDLLLLKSEIKTFDKKNKESFRFIAIRIWNRDSRLNKRFFALSIFLKKILIKNRNVLLDLIFIDMWYFL